MTEQEICKHLDGKLEEFLLKFDEVLRNKLKEKLYFAGGCIYSLANSQEPRDYDLFMTDLSLMNELVNLDIWKFVSDYALSVGKFQIVHKYYGEPSYCVGQFDFLHNMHYYIPFSNKIRNAYTEEDEEKEFEDGGIDCLSESNLMRIFFQEGRYELNPHFHSIKVKKIKVEEKHDYF